jgi:hypothetical protein
MTIFGHSTGTALVTFLVALLAAGCVFSGAWGLSGRAVWLPDSGPLDGALTHPDLAPTILRGRGARVAGVVLIAFGLVFAVAALRVWRANSF